MSRRFALYHALSSKFDMGKILIGVALPLMCLGVGVPAYASAPSASHGKDISGMCAACHGSEGIAINSSYPNLAGQNYQYLLHQLQAFKDGQRSNPMMHSMTAGLSKEQMQDLAAYFASLGPKKCKTGKSQKKG